MPALQLREADLGKKTMRAKLNAARRVEALRAADEWFSRVLAEGDAATDYLNGEGREGAQDGWTDAEAVHALIQSVLGY